MSRRATPTSPAGRSRSDGIGGRPRDVSAAVWQGPDGWPWSEVVDVPAGGLLGLVVRAAQRMQVAETGPAALVVGDGVVEVAAFGVAAAAGRGAGGLSDLDQVT